MRALRYFACCAFLTLQNGKKLSCEFEHCKKATKTHESSTLKIKINHLNLALKKTAKIHLSRAPLKKLQKIHLSRALT